jgi:phage N-6-adenine-methyltransferase
MVDSANHILECGRLLVDKKAELGHGNFIPWVEAECDFHESTARRLMAASKRALTHDLTEDDAIAISRETWGNDRKSVVTTYTGKGDWQTPEKFIAPVRSALGRIDLDPASSEEANKTVQAEKIYTKADDGLSLEWEGNVFINPPYDSGSIKGFVDKLADEIQAERVSKAILLTNNSTDTLWWQKAASLATAICFTRGRINFEDESGRAGNTNGQTYMYFGDDLESFVDSFQDIGWIGYGRR